MSLTLALVWLGLAPAHADDGGMHPAMKCAPEDQECIDEANREYEQQQRRIELGASEPKKAKAKPRPAAKEKAEGKEIPSPPPRAPVVERRFYRDDGLYLSVVLVDGEVRTVEAHPVAVVERAAREVAPEDVLREEQADILERSAQTWVELAVEELPPELDRQIDVEPVPAG